MPTRSNESAGDLEYVAQRRYRFQGQFPISPLEDNTPGTAPAMWSSESLRLRCEESLQRTRHRQASTISRFCLERKRATPLSVAAFPALAPRPAMAVRPIS